MDVILGAEGAFYWDNDELAHRVFDLLAHKFPQKWFMVGVGNSPSNGLSFRLLKGQSQDLLHGTIKVSPGHSPFAFFDRRQFPRENETELWYFVRAVDPIEAKEGAETNSNKMQKKLTECVRKETKRWKLRKSGKLSKYSLILAVAFRQALPPLVPLTFWH